MVIKLVTPIPQDKINKLKTGDQVSLSGIIYTMRDAVHKKLVGQLSRNEKIPVYINNAIIYYCGPAPAKPDEIIGACGPTTSSRMDVYTPLLLRYGLKGMIGKGQRSNEIVKAIKKHKAVYFVALGGGGALLSKYVKESTLIAYPELGTEAIYRFVIENFPLIVAIDSKGNNLFQQKYNL